MRKEGENGESCRGANVSLKTTLLPFTERNSDWEDELENTLGLLENMNGKERLREVVDLHSGQPAEMRARVAKDIT